MENTITYLLGLFDKKTNQSIQPEPEVNKTKSIVTETKSLTPEWDKLKADGKIKIRKINTAVALPTKAPVLTHKAYCSKCNRDSFISWLIIQM